MLWGRLVSFGNSEDDSRNSRVRRVRWEIFRSRWIHTPERTRGQELLVVLRGYSIALPKFPSDVCALGGGGSEDTYSLAPLSVRRLPRSGFTLLRRHAPPVGSSGMLR